jgi:hypothetical protein
MNLVHTAFRFSLLIILVGTGLAARAAEGAAAAEPLAPATKFEAFQGIASRNIFNAFRTGPASSRSGLGNAQAPAAPYLALVGTLDSDKGYYAFFDGSDAAYRKALKVGESIAGFTLASIAPNQAELRLGKQSFPLSIQQQLRRGDGDAWTVSAFELPSAPAPSASDGKSASPEIPANASEVLKRLLEKRQKQLSQ